MSVRNGIVTPQAMRILTAIAALQASRRGVTWRRLIGVLGLKSTNSITYGMKVLYGCGLIAAGPDSYGGRRRGGGTIRPTCRFIPADHLGRKP